MAKSRTNIKAYTDTYITTNDNGDISGKDANTLFNDLADSALMTEDIVNDDTTGGEDSPVSAEVAKTHGDEIDAIQTQSNTNTSEIARVESDLTDDINGIDNAVDKNTEDIETINLDLVGLIKKYGVNGRIRFDDKTKHFYFEILKDGAWIIKAEIGKSIIVDALRLIKADKPTDIIPTEIALYNREITLPDESITVRPTVVLPNGDEYGFIYENQQTGEVQLRQNNGDLVNIPIIYTHNGVSYSDLNNVEFLGLVDVLQTGKSLKVSILNNINDASKLKDRTYSSEKIEGLIPTPSDIVSDINEELGNTTWQTGGQQPIAIDTIDGGNSAVIHAGQIDGGNSKD